MLGAGGVFFDATDVGGVGRREKEINLIVFPFPAYLLHPLRPGKQAGIRLAPTIRHFYSLKQ